MVVRLSISMGLSAPPTSSHAEAAGSVGPDHHRSVHRQHGLAGGRPAGRSRLPAYSTTSSTTAPAPRDGGGRADDLLTRLPRHRAGSTGRSTCFLAAPPRS